MSKQRRTADDFVRDMKAKRQHSTPSERKTSAGLTPEQAGAWHGKPWPDRLAGYCGGQEQPQPSQRFLIGRKRRDHTGV